MQPVTVNVTANPGDQLSAMASAPIGNGHHPPPQPPPPGFQNPAPHVVVPVDASCLQPQMPIAAAPPVTELVTETPLDGVVIGGRTKKFFTFQKRVF